VKHAGVGEEAAAGTLYAMQGSMEAMAGINRIVPTSVEPGGDTVAGSRVKSGMHGHVMIVRTNNRLTNSSSKVMTINHGVHCMVFSSTGASSRIMNFRTCMHRNIMELHRSPIRICTMTMGSSLRAADRFRVGEGPVVGDGRSRVGECTVSARGAQVP
jgi:hypothetical protein